MKTAMLYRSINGDLQCDLCAHRCRIKPGMAGICMVRKNQEGILYTLAYGRTMAMDVDPVEKKPLFHFLPGSAAYSIATVGCNFHCRFCQNWELSQALREDHFAMGTRAAPEEIVQDALNTACSSIAYTYTEPTIFFEYAYETAILAKKQGLYNIFVTNGYQTPECIDMIAPYLDAANVDLKAFSDEFYRKVLGGRLQPVLDSLRYMKTRGIWLEITTLVIPGWNDSESELQAAAQFIVSELGPDTPWHLSRFYPAYRMHSIGATPEATVLRTMRIGREAGLRYVYAGNLPSGDFANTYCPACHKEIVCRAKFDVIKNDLVNGKCRYCGMRIPGVWSLQSDKRHLSA
ncbi:MAG TPA: AmmeMemoRadiSam system radical SAM enzyme [Acidobacteriota bacterium]|nr:AmmeMemoRadiSam system radical SAM enzyme [Acidobacteriota bacterium]